MTGSPRPATAPPSERGRRAPLQPGAALSAALLAALLPALACIPITRKDPWSGLALELVVQPQPKDGLAVLLFEKKKGFTAPHPPSSWEEKIIERRPVWVRPLARDAGAYPKARDLAWLFPLPPFIGYGRWSDYRLIVLAPGMHEDWPSSSSRVEAGSKVRLEKKLVPHATPRAWMDHTERVLCLLLGDCQAYTPNSLAQEERDLLARFLCGEIRAIEKADPGLRERSARAGGRLGCGGSGRERRPLPRLMPLHSGE